MRIDSNIAKLVGRDTNLANALTTLVRPAIRVVDLLIAPAHFEAAHMDAPLRFGTIAPHLPFDRSPAPA